MIVKIEPLTERTRKVRLDFSDEKSSTQQYHRDRVDINTIVAKYRKTGFMSKIMDKGSYGDFSKAEDYNSAQIKLTKARQAFEALPASIRKEFDNDPAKLIEFINNPENVERCVELGLLEKTALPEVVLPNNVPEGTTEPLEGTTE